MADHPVPWTRAERTREIGYAAAIEPPPAGRASLRGMGGLQVTEHEAHDWTCDMPRCQEQARHLSRFLCDRHARNFAVNHGIDIAAVCPPEVPG
jgi:hypothetical protein